MEQASQAQQRNPRKRYVKNFLLDRTFQLRYANFAALVAAVLSLFLGTLLWYSTEQTLRFSAASVELGEEVLKESEKVSEVVAMNIAREYADNPVLKAAFEQDSAARQTKLEEQKQQLASRMSQVQKNRSRSLSILLGALTALVALLWGGAIIATHRIAGPLFKIRRQFAALGGGDYSDPSPLRKHDDLKGFFGAFSLMVRELRERQEVENKDLERAIAMLEDAHDSEQALRILQEMRQIRRGSVRS